MVKFWQPNLKEELPFIYDDPKAQPRRDNIEPSLCKRENCTLTNNVVFVRILLLLLLWVQAPKDGY